LVDTFLAVKANRISGFFLKSTENTRILLVISRSILHVGKHKFVIIALENRVILKQYKLVTSKGPRFVAKQDSHSSYNVTSRRVRVTIVVVEK